MQVRGAYHLLELKKLDAGFAFVADEVIEDIGPYRLDERPPESTLHKVVRPWNVKGQSVEVLVFDDIGVYACVNYEDGEKGEGAGPYRLLGAFRGSLFGGSFQRS